MHIDEIQKLVGASTPGEAVAKVRALVEGFPGDKPPDTTRIVAVKYAPGYSNGYGTDFWHKEIEKWNSGREVVRWWELPVSPQNN